MHSEDCTETNERMPESPRSSSWQISPYDTAFMPAQPYSVGSEEPSRPIAAISGTRCFGNSPLSKHSPMIGSTRSSVKRATVSCTMRSSSESIARTSYRS